MAAAWRVLGRPALAWLPIVLAACAVGKIEDTAPGTSGPNLAGTLDGGSDGADSTGRDSSPPPPPPPVDDTGPTCDVGSDGCPCTAGGSCDAGLMCDGGVCLPSVEVCGDGVVSGDEECDDGAGNSDQRQCKTDCTQQRCGDGSVGPGEACDDGDRIDDNECTNRCALASCGDAQVQPPEECDDGDADDSDECLSTCLAASCGDGIVQTGVEECDDSNADDTDDCLSDCAVATCGDAAVHDGVEECDDGDADDADGCTQACLCRLTFEVGAHTGGWGLTGGWGIYAAAPPSSNMAVPFVTQGQVFGTDGNRSMPYPGGEVETSSATTSSFSIPETIRFRSWHVDEGGASFDTKRVLVSIDAGTTWDPLVDCAVGPNAGLPFCVYQSGPRLESAWDDIEVDAAAFAGVPGQLRFEYATVDSCCSFEQGWFLDDLNALDCP